MFRNLWFQLHWFVGITAGIVLALVGVTGAMLSFEHDIIRMMNPGVMTVTPSDAPRLSPDQLIERIRTAAPERDINWLGLSADEGDAARVNFAGGGRRGETVYVDPDTGRLLGQPVGEGFFLDVMRLHRWLLVGDVGKQIVGASTLLLIGLCLTGLYLRWPRKALDWRAWLTFSFKRKGRSFLWDMHSVLGTWVLPLYLLASVTGLYWSYEWYRDGLYSLSGVERPVRGGPPGGASNAGASETPGTPSLDSAWTVFQSAVDGYSEARLSLPSAAGQPVQIRYLDADPAHERASNNIAIDPVSGEVVSHERYADKPLNEKLMGSILPLHSGSYFGTGGLVLMMIASVGMPLFAITGWMLYLDRRRKKKATRAALRAVSDRNESGGDPVLIAYASQSGTAERYAWLSAGTLQAAGVPVTVKPLGSVRPADLSAFKQALFAVASFGDGEAPDNARGFARRMSDTQPALSDLRYGLLALGDRAYERYCGFGRAVAEWLDRHGARPLFDTVEVDGADAGALATWQSRLAVLTGREAEAAAWADEDFQRWRLCDRQLLNPASQGEGTYHLELEPADGAKLDWRAGDVAEVVVGPMDERAAQYQTREYSIASTPEDGTLQLLVRQSRRADGSLGAGSGWLTVQAAVGGEVGLRIRRNTAFHGPADYRPMLLIGNGTGIAGLRSHLKARISAGACRNWLIFGERNAAHDFYYRDELEGWQRDGALERLDLAFSRDQASSVYVQDRLAENASTLRQWMGEGAAIYVCGSLQGMAPAVEQVLVDVLGQTEVERLISEGRYRRDVY